MASCTHEIFEQLMEGIRNGMTLQQQVDLQADNPDYPHINTIRKYISTDNQRMSIYTHARETGADAMADETIIIADTVRDTQHAANRIKARQWHASKMKPKVYGDKLDVDLNHKIDVSTAILEARRRAGLLSDDRLTIDNQLIDVTEENSHVDPFT